MKLLKKITLLGLAAITAFSLGLVAACDDDETSSPIDSSTSSSVEEEVTDYVCRIKVENETGYGFKGVTVALYDGDTEIASETTSSAGYATFSEDEISIGKYSVRVNDIPNGYAFAEPDTNFVVEAWKGFQLSVKIAPQGVIKEDPPIGTSYKLGDVVHDFTLVTSDGDDFTLSEVLKEKGMVLLNFWATWCGPCKSEFPAMNNAYVAYQDKVEVLAVSTTDSMTAVKEFKSSNGLQFKMTSNSESGADLVSMFPSAGIPLSVMIDRYGVVTYYHMGSMTEAKDFTSRFEKFLGDDYKPTIIVGAGETGDDDNQGGGTTNLIKPTVTAPSLDEVKNVLAGGSNDFTFSWDSEDEYAWPFLVSEGGDSLYSPIAKESVHGNYSTLKATFTAGPGDAVLFDCLVNSEITDVLYFLVDGVPVQQFSGTNNDLKWQEVNCGYYFKEGYDVEGEHELIFIYRKDGDTSVDRETAQIKNLVLKKDVDESTLQLHNYRHAANIVNEDENATTMYKHYANVVYNEADGYYHVDRKDGPILYANMMLSSRWSDMSVWILAYSGYIVHEGYNFSSDIEDHAWAASQYIPGFEYLNGYVPVTEELKELLVYATKSESIGADGYKNWTGAWHENEWLETCAYYDSHGINPLKDHMETITFHAAKQVYEGENTANILYNMVPRGFKYKFIPEKNGVYNIYSTAEINAYADPVCFYFGESTTDYVYYDEVLHSREGDGNFNFHAYMEAGKTYYFAMATFADVSGSYTFNIDYHGETYTYLTNCATIETFNEVTNETYLYDGIEYVYSEEDGYYHVKNEDGTPGSIIYVDMTRPTMFFQSDSLQSIANDALMYETERRAFYVNGVDYTETIAYYARQSNFNTPEGYVPLNQELMDVLKAITGKYEGIDDSWQLLCYYEVVLGA